MGEWVEEEQLRDWGIEFLNPSIHLKLTVGILPLVFGQQGFNNVPMLGDLTVLNTEQVVESDLFAGKAAFGLSQDKVALAKDQVDIPYFHGQAGSGHFRHCLFKAGQTIANTRIVLDEFFSTYVFGNFVMLMTQQDLIIKGLDEGFVSGCLLKAAGRCGTVGHAVAVPGGGHGFLQVVPMFHNQAIFKTEDVKTDFGTEEIVFGMSEDIIIVLKGPDHLDLETSWRPMLQQIAERRQPITNHEVVLDVLV